MILAALALGCTLRAGGALPDPRCTPGATDPRVTPATIHQTICVAGYTATVRPTSVPKRRLLKTYRLNAPRAGFELDHLISLQLGGHPSDERNLWPQAYPDARVKDVVETWAKREVCAGRMTLEHAQTTIRADWRELRAEMQQKGRKTR